MAHIDGVIQYARNGDLKVPLLVPYQFAHLAEPLTTVVGLPLSFDVEIWAPYTEAKNAQ
jgi:hypothetical protein